MERLTEKRRFKFFRPDEETTTVCVDGYFEMVENDNDFSDGKETHYYLAGEAIDKLAEYEDAEEQGLLLRLPYDLGTCGVLYYACKEDSEVYRLRADEVTISKTMISNKFCYLIDSFEFCFEDFGKIIFRTKAEAEKALEEMGEGKGKYE